MHARLDELLSLRDGAPVDARVRAHVDGCAECATELTRTESLRAQLRALPAAPAMADDGWAGVEARLAASRRRCARVARIAPVAAAGAVVALGLFATLRVVDPAAPSAERPAPLTVLETDSLDDLRARSQALEALLAAMPERPAVERAGTSVPIESLEAQVQWLDHQLSLADADGRMRAAEQLWRDRVEVMNSLVQLRYLEVQQVVL
jgi:hypothetical protein